MHKPETSWTDSRQPRLAIVCDFREERWYSMDLIAGKLAENLQISPANCYAECLTPPFRKLFTQLPFMEHIKLPYNADRAMNRFYRYPAWLRKHVGAFDLFHVIDHSYAHLVHELPPGKAVVTCHDIDAFRCLLADARSLKSRFMRGLTRRILSGLQAAERVVCVSAATREELLGHEWIRPERIKVIYSGVDSVFSPITDPAAQRHLTELMGPMAGKPRVLHIGSNIRRKRIDVLLRAFARIKVSCPEAVLVKVGGVFSGDQRELLRTLSIKDSVIELPYLEHGFLAELYRTSELLLFPSESEGFGLPVVESMACGTPVVAADIPALREAGGDAALYAPVADVAAFAQAGLQLLREAREDAAGRERRRQACLLQAKKFKWSECATQMVDVYRAVLLQSGFSGSQADASS